MFCFAQEELASLKDKLEQKEAEIKRLQEKLQVNGEGVDINDRGKINGEKSFRPPKPWLILRLSVVHDFGLFYTGP